MMALAWQWAVLAEIAAMLAAYPVAAWVHYELRASGRLSS